MVKHRITLISFIICTMFVKPCCFILKKRNISEKSVDLLEQNPNVVFLHPAQTSSKMSNVNGLSGKCLPLFLLPFFNHTNVFYKLIGDMAVVM